MAKKPHVPSVALGAPREPEWLVGMRQHYAETGTYRQGDVQRVLGAPWDRVEIATKLDSKLSSKVAD